MPWEFIISVIGIPAMKFVLRLIEKKYPGLTPVIEMILKYLDGGGSMKELSLNIGKHCEGVGCPADLVGKK